MTDLREALFRPLDLADADHADTDPAAGIAGGLSSVVRLGVDDDTAADDGIPGSDQGDGFGNHGHFGNPFGIRLEVPEVAGVDHVTVGHSVVVTFRIVVAAGAGAVLGGDVAELVDVEAVFGVGLESADLGGDLDSGPALDIPECDRAAQFAATCGNDDGDQFSDGIENRPGGRHRVDSGFFRRAGG